MLVMPPWPHEDHIQPSADAGPNPFRVRHGLDGKFVVMYSGNHSPSNPLTTLLAAAIRLKDDDALRFLFVGGGHGKREVEAAIRNQRLTNVVSLPYQPLADLRHSLSAADAHVVSLGDNMVGIIHPCKIYGALSVGRPVVYLGPRPSHIGDLLETHDLGVHVAHGDVDGALTAIASLRALSWQQRQTMAVTARRVLDESLGQQQLSDRLCAAVERTFHLQPV